MLIFPLFIPHRGCPQTCIYCDQYQISGVLEINWSYLQSQLANFCHIHQNEEKEIAFYGGSFTCLPHESQNELYSIVTPFLDEQTHIRYSTRPDGISEDILKNSFLRGVRTVELGIQDFSDQVLDMTQRGYTRQQALDACKSVKQSNLELSVQLMPGLPGYCASSLQSTIEDTISIKPEYVRIYPTIVIAGTPLEKMFRDGDYSPLSYETALKDVCLMVEQFEASGIKVIKIGITGIDKECVIAGPYHQSFGEMVRSEIFIQKILSKHVPDLVLTISKMDVSLLKGHKKEYLTRIKSMYNQSDIKIRVSDTLNKGEFQYIETEDFILW
jgi:histone acetyltransferase (RNA polymerase elongator complex component)